MADGAMTKQDEARAKAYATPLDQFQVHELEHFTSDTLWPWFERLRAEGPGALHRRQRVRPLLVDHPLRRHRSGWRATTTGSPHIVRAWRHHPVHGAGGCAAGSVLGGADQLSSFHGRTAPRRSAPRRRANLLDPRAGRVGAVDPVEGRHDPRRAADRRDLRLRRQGGDRADQPDASDSVRFPVRAAPDIAALLRHAAVGSAGDAGRGNAAPGGDVRHSRPVRAACGTPAPATRPDAT